MNVGEMIEELQKYAPNLRVVTDGYEDGYTEVQAVRTRTLFAKDEAHPEYYGEFDDGGEELAVYLPR